MDEILLLLVGLSFVISAVLAVQVVTLTKVINRLGREHSNLQQQLIRCLEVTSTLASSVDRMLKLIDPLTNLVYNRQNPHHYNPIHAGDQDALYDR